MWWFTLREDILQIIMIRTLVILIEVIEAQQGNALYTGCKNLNVTISRLTLFINVFFCKRISGFFYCIVSHTVLGFNYCVFFNWGIYLLGVSPRVFNFFSLKSPSVCFFIFLFLIDGVISVSSSFNLMFSCSQFSLL